MSTRALTITTACIATAGTLVILGLIASSGALGGLTSALVLATVVVMLALGAAVFLSVRALRRESHVRATRLSNLERRISSLTTRLESLEGARAHPARAPAEAALNALQARVDQLEARESVVAPIDANSTAALVALGRGQGLPLRAFLSPAHAAGAIRRAIDQHSLLEAVPYLEEFPEAVDQLGLSESRTLLKGLRRLGYLALAVPVIESIAARFGNASDERAARLYASELALYRGEVELVVEEPEHRQSPEAGVVLHLVGKALPETQSGYTLRTQYTVEAQARLGLRPIVVAQSGASDRPHAMTETYEHRGIRYYLLGGPQRGSVEWDAWLRANVEALADVVRATRPGAIHTHSDFMNAMIALPVARAFGIPLINETRGFWEESWLSRTATAEGWLDLDELESGAGLPDMYRLRVEREAHTRSSSDAVVTLARVMEGHIERVGDDLDLSVPPISIAPNSVEARDFPVRTADPALRRELGIEESAVVIGYISSIVEYEGIDTLVRAAFELASAVDASRELRATDIDAAPSSTEATAESLATDESSADASAAPLSALRVALAAGESEYRRDGPAAAAGDDMPAAEVEPALAQLVRRLHALAPLDDAEAVQGRAVALLEAVRPFDHLPLRLLVVGDGPELRNLRSLASELGLDSAIFPGRVPHEQVLDYYGLIDLFVVPRRRAAVTELVTPLKPFEAMATGRPCVFSDVGALAEIAEDSGCVELFHADDHHDLAMRAAALLADPERLADMSRGGASWVRNARTWDMNALAYVEVYRSLGVELGIDAGVDDLLALRERGVGAATVVQRLADGPTPDPTGWFLLEAKRYPAERIIRDGWQIAKHPAIRFEPGMDWEAAGRENRSWGFHLHAWEFIDPALQEHAETGDEALLRWMIDVALDWWSAVQGKPTTETMAWYDMALSLRMPRLARLIIAAAKSPLAAEAPRLLLAALEHVRRAEEDEAFNSGNNHGFFAAAAALDFARWLVPLPGSAALRELGQGRMRTMLARQFGADGGHLEHSPDYHRMLLRSFESALQEGLIEDADTAARIERASRVLGWLVQPDGALVQFGDSPRFDVDANELTSIDPRTTFILTDGRSGEPEREEMLVLPDTGYAIVRSPQPDAEGQRRQSSYLALQAGFHSRAHKHADDLTFTWFDRGREILVDAGRFGYIDLLAPDSPDRLKGFYYSAPERQYVESTRAHNTVEVNGEDIQRRSRTPFGSALGRCERAGEQFVLSASVQHGTYRHERTLELTPGRALVVSDALIVENDPIEAVAWFNLPGECSVEVDAEAARVIVEADGFRMTVRSSGELVMPVRGQRDPLRGWRSVVDRELVPTWSLGYRARVEGDGVVRTEFTLE